MTSIKIKSDEEFTSSIEKLKWVMACLRDPENGCPWDKEQDFKSIMPYTIEEAYEVADAIENGSMDHLEEELGDLLLQVIYHAQMASEENIFSFDSVAQKVADKMISRHPHVFGDVDAQNSADVTEIWEQQKSKETQSKGVLDNVTLGLPSLLRAEKLQHKAAKVGFEWPTPEHAFDKCVEEMNEFIEAIDIKDAYAQEEEFGDLMFALTNYARMKNINAEEAVRKANNKFIHRFKGMEKAVENSGGKDGKTIKDLSLEEMLDLWIKQKS